MTTIADWAVARDVRALLLIAVVALLCILPGFFTTPPIDRDETLFAQASRQMVESGDYVDIRFQDQPRHKKPIGIYWVQSATVHLATAVGVPEASAKIWVYRLPSLMGAVGAALLTWWVAIALVSRRAAFLAGLMVATSLLLGAEARLAKTDAFLLATIVAAMGALARVWMAGRRGEAVPVSTAVVFWTALAAGVLVKGPIILMVVGLAAVALVGLSRSIRWLGATRPLPGLAGFVLLVLPWFVAITLASGGAFFEESLGRDFLGKAAVEGGDGRWAPPLTYLALVWVTFWPAAPLLALAAPAVLAARREPAILFLLAWAIPTWIVFEIVPTKLVHYVLPTYPALAMLAAWALVEGRLALANPHLRRTLVMWPIFAVLIPASLVGASIWLTGIMHPLAWPLIALAGACGWFAWATARTSGPEAGVLLTVPAALVVAIAAWGIVLPQTRPLWVGADARQLVASAGCPAPAVATAGYREPSLVFNHGKDLLMTDGRGAADFLAGGGCRVALVSRPLEQQAFRARAAELGLGLRLLGTLPGLAINGARPFEMQVFAADAGARR